MSLRAEILRLALAAQKKIRSRQEPPPAKVRRRLRLIEPIVPRPPAGTKVTAFEADGIRAVETVVRQARTDRCVLYFHGGGYVVGAEPLFRDFIWRIGVAARACVLYFDYRLAPEHPFPAAVEDASRIYRWLLGHRDAARIAFLGDSAGGGLAFAALIKARDECLPMPAVVVALSPWTDLALTGPSLQANARRDPMMDAARLPIFAQHYLGGADPRDPHASPLHGNLSGLPPTFIQVSRDEILRDDSVRMAEKLRAAGCEAEVEEWPRMPHVWHHYARILPEGQRAIARAGEFLQGKF